MRLIVLLIFVLYFSSIQADDRIDQLTKRIEELESQQEELMVKASEERSQVNSFLNDNLSFGGFFEPAYSVISGPDTETQATYTSSALGINLAADYGTNLRFVTQFITALAFPLQNENNRPDANPSSRSFKTPVFGTLLTQGYLEYIFNSNFQLQGGVGYVPFGYAFQQRELVLFVRRGGPQLLRTADIVSPLWQGLNFVGHFDQKESSWGFNLYSFNPVSSPSHPGLGARVFWSDAEEEVIAGLSTQWGKIGAKNYDTLGGDLKLELDQFRVVSELAYGFFEGEDPWSAYVEPGMYVLNEELLIYIFGDYSNNAYNKVTIQAAQKMDPIQKWEYGGGVNWLPTSFTRIRLGFTIHDYVGSTATVLGQKRDYTSIDMSAGIAF